MQLVSDISLPSYAGHVTEWPLYLSTINYNILDPEATITFTGENWGKVNLNLIVEAKKEDDITVIGEKPDSVTLTKRSIDKRSTGEGMNDPDAKDKASGPLDPKPTGLGAGGVIGIVIAIIAVIAGVGSVYWFVIRPRMMINQEDNANA